MEILLSIYLFMLGASLASFISASVYRYLEEFPLKRFINEQSHCEKCKKKLAWYELIPVFSWLFSMGKCRNCGFLIPYYYFLGELLLGLTFTLIYLNGFGVQYYILACVLYMLANFDIILKGVPKHILNFLLCVALVYFVLVFLTGGSVELITLAIALGVSLAVLLLNLLKKSFGVGDLLVMVIIACVVSTQELVITLLASIMIGAVISLVFVAKDRKWLKKFIPFMFLGYLFTLIYALW